MVAAAAPSPAPARRGLPTAPRRAGPERPPWGGDGVGPGRQGLCGRRDADGGRAREGGRRPLVSAPTAPGGAGLFVWAA